MVTVRSGSQLPSVPHNDESHLGNMQNVWLQLFLLLPERWIGVTTGIPSVVWAHFNLSQYKLAGFLL